MKRIVFISFLTCFTTVLFAQQFTPTSSGQIFLKLKKLNVLGSVMYLAAHPDDENTRLISYFTNEKFFETTYLSLTRGDGGQNLIGTELGASLGVLRTLELLKARSVDGGMQWFTRANDFGFSKHPDETLEFWNEDAILSDIVNAIRKFRPDVIVNRFTTRNPGGTHGHHSASAILAEKAIKLAADPNYKIPGSTYPAWQVTNMYFNTSYFFYKSQEDFDKADKKDLFQVDCGLFYPVMGFSNGEIAAKSRSMHKCQGFGSAYSRGSNIEYLELLAGPEPKVKNRPFDNLSTTWNRVKGGNEIGSQLENVIRNFDFKNPENAVPELIEIAGMIQKIEDPFWKEIKLREINSIILDCLGFYMEATVQDKIVCPGDSIKVNLEYTIRNNVPATLVNLSLLGNNYPSKYKDISFNKDFKESFVMQVPISVDLSTPYWLQGNSAPMMYQVKNRDLIGRPENPYQLTGHLMLSVLGYRIDVPVEILYKQVDPAYGQRYGEVQIAPPVTVNLSGSSVLAKKDGSTSVKCSVIGFKPDLKGRVTLNLPKGWVSTPAFHDVELKLKGESKDFEFTIHGPDFEGIDSIGAQVDINGKEYYRGFREIQYEHVPYRIINISNKVGMSIIAPVKDKQLIGYIEGAGDLVFQSLQGAGYQIELIPPDKFNIETFRKYSAILVGIRAFNVLNHADILNKNLNEYAAAGGRVVVQYNTNRGLKVESIGPYSLTLGRTRVTDEHAEVNILLPDHPLLNMPNKITRNDFKYWVQERGLYFADKFDEKYQALLGMHDKNEKESNGSLIFAPVGKGSFVYTGLVFYRELPAGIPGAYRLMENLLYNPAK
ncbi:MAG: PIG-L family deacetylase [Saprospiraceae bacterium]|nr:PIG-L family deacetylase [Saprospiraceae bacterium]